MADRWPPVRLEQIVDLLPGRYLPREHYVESGPYFVYGSNSVMGRHSEALYDGPMVVMAAIGANCGAVRFSQQGAWVNNNAFALTPKEGTDARFIYYWLTMLPPLAIRAGTGQPYVKRQALMAQRLALPPISEQRRIADLLATVDLHLSSTGRAWRACATAKSAVIAARVLHHMEQWPHRSLGDVAWIQQGKRVEHAAVDALGHPVYGANGVIGSWHRATYSHSVVGLGCRGSVGTVHLVPPNSWLGNNVMALWPRQDTVLSLDFLKILLELVDLRKAGAISGQVQPQITREGLAPVSIPMPDPQEQTEVKSLVRTIEQQSLSLAKIEERLKDLRSSITPHLMSGTVRLPVSYDRFLE